MLIGLWLSQQKYGGDLKMEFAKLSAPTLKELFIHNMEHRIISGEIKVGDKLPPEREIAAAMQISRAVVNSGITELARKGFITIKPRIGAFVADFRKTGTLETLVAIMNYNGGVMRYEEVKSILEIRVALDTMAVELALAKITDDDVAHLEGYVEQIKTAPDPEAASEFAYLFQHELAVLSGNTILPLIFYSFRSPILGLWNRFCVLHGIASLYKNNRILCSYIRKRDFESAKRFIHSSIEDTIHGNRQIYF